MLERDIQTDIRLMLSETRAGVFLRYNVGTFLTLDGRPVKIGEPVVSDLIGVTPHVIRQEDVGKTVGVFVAMETKKPKDGTSKKRKRSQGNFIQIVKSLGGSAGIVRSVDDAKNLIKSCLTQAGNE
jgi:hypothetical protein